MTIQELNWKRSRIGIGLYASYDFDNGRTAHILHAGGTYDLQIRARDGRIIYARSGLDSAGLTARLNYHGMLP